MGQFRFINLLIKLLLVRKRLIRVDRLHIAICSCSSETRVESNFLYDPLTFISRLSKFLIKMCVVKKKNCQFIYRSLNLENAYEGICLRKYKKVFKIYCWKIICCFYSNKRWQKYNVWWLWFFRYIFNFYFLNAGE